MQPIKATMRFQTIEEFYRSTPIETTRTPHTQLKHPNIPIFSVPKILTLSECIQRLPECMTTELTASYLAGSKTTLPSKVIKVDDASRKQITLEHFNFSKLNASTSSMAKTPNKPPSETFSKNQDENRQLSRRTIKAATNDTYYGPLVDVEPKIQNKPLEPFETGGKSQRNHTRILYQKVFTVVNNKQNIGDVNSDNYANSTNNSTKMNQLKRFMGNQKTSTSDGAYWNRILGAKLKAVHPQQPINKPQTALKNVLPVLANHVEAKPFDGSSQSQSKISHHTFRSINSIRTDLESNKKLVSVSNGNIPSQTQTSSLSVIDLRLPVNNNERLNASVRRRAHILESRSVTKLQHLNNTKQYFDSTESTLNKQFLQSQHPDRRDVDVCSSTSSNYQQLEPLIEKPQQQNPVFI